jgi:hypothetical protein
MCLEILTTAALSVAAGVPPDVMLIALDAGLLAGHVRLVAGRPVCARLAVEALERTSQIAGLWAAGDIPTGTAWRLAKQQGS